MWEVEQGIQSSPQCNRQSECHHPDQDEHGASAHTYNFMHRAFTDVYTIREYIEREYVVLRQIEYNQTNWITPRLRYAMLYLLEIRCIVNDTLEIKIPDSTNQTLFLELTSQGWFKNPRFRLGQQ